jgi:hypothetical protein
MLQYTETLVLFWLYTFGYFRYFCQICFPSYWLRRLSLSSNWSESFQQGNSKLARLFARAADTPTFESKGEKRGNADSMASCNIHILPPHLHLVDKSGSKSKLREYFAYRKEDEGQPTETTKQKVLQSQAGHLWNKSVFNIFDDMETGH